MVCSRPAPWSMGILQARILEWVAMPSSRGSSRPRDQTQVSRTAGGFFTICATREAPLAEQCLSFWVCLISFLGFPGGSAGKESTCSAGDLGLIPGLGRSPGEGNDYPLQYSGLENSMDCIVYGVSKSRKRLSDLLFLIPFSMFSKLIRVVVCTSLLFMAE